MSAQPRKEKRAYRKPVLRMYGKVKSLTESGGSEPLPDAGQATRMPPSDPLLKERVVRIGDHPLGIGLYLFDYKAEYRSLWGQERQFGVMADEVETVMPAAVSRHPDGYRLVNYEMLGIRRAAQ